MQQSNVIFAFLLVAFIVFITTRGELSTYIELLRGSGNADTSSSKTSPVSSSTDLPSLPSIASFTKELQHPGSNGNLGTGDPIADLKNAGVL